MAHPERTRIATTVVEDLRQSHSAKQRKNAIPQFAKGLRRQDRFQSSWDAVGGASGLVSLMAQFSIKDLRNMCRRLGQTASAENVRPQRRQALGELVTILYQGQQDSRPLNSFYQNIIPACHLELIQQYEKDHGTQWTRPQERCLFLGHREQHEQRFLNDIFSKEEGLRFFAHREVFRGNIAFIDKILTTLVAKEAEVHVPSDFVDEVVMPLLRRLLKSRFSDETRNKYLHLVLQCIEKHDEEISGQLNLQQGGLVQYTVDRWFSAPDGSRNEQQVKTYLVRSIKLLPVSGNRMSLDKVLQAVVVSRRLDLEASYEFFRLLLLHMKDYRVNIESDSEQDLDRLKQDMRNEAWPADLFFQIDLKKSLRLFGKLDRLFPNSEFLSPVSSGSTVLRQTQSHQGHLRHSSFGDVETARALLIRKSKMEDEHQGWLQRARGLIGERRVNAQQAREAADRALWARSALNLCVAAGDLETLNDTIIWARRFIKDSQASKTLYGVEVFRTAEIDELLGAMPDAPFHTPETVVSFTSSLAERNIELANSILVNLAETATMAVAEPGFRPQNWAWLFNLVKAVSERRMKKLDTLFENLTKCSESDRASCQREMMDVVWKPTTDVLIKIRAIIRNPVLETVRGRSLLDSLTPDLNYDFVNGSYVYRMLSNTSLSPPMLAELARFFIDQTRIRLGSEAMRTQMGTVVFVIGRLADSDQPSLACPFIRDLVLDSEDAKESSSWHRHLVSKRFLSALPSQAAREMLFTMAGAVKEKMREQNQNTDTKEEAERAGSESREGVDAEAPAESSQSQGPSIKVTTVKMLAQLLQYNLFIDPLSSCDILIGLLAEARHIDIRITITNSLFAIMEESSCPPHLRQRILDALEEHIVPVVAQLSERRGVTEAGWLAASQDGANLHAVGGEIPLLELLIDKIDGKRLNDEDGIRLAQLVMGAVEQSAINNYRWMKLFLAKNNFTLEEGQDIPRLPVKIDILSSLFRRLRAYMPMSVFNMVRSAALVNIDPPPGIARITKAIEQDRDLVNSKAGKHWISQFRNPRNQSLRYGVVYSAPVLQSPASMLECKTPQGISVQSFQSFVMEYVERLFKLGYADMIESLVQRLSLKGLNDRKSWQAGRENCLPIIREMIQMTEVLQERIRNRETEPRLLPNIFRMRLNTLPVPPPHPTANEEEAFTAELYKLIDELAGRQNVPYHVDFEKLKEEVNKWSRGQSLGHYALQLARMQEYNLASKEQPGLGAYLCWEFLGHMIIAAEDPKNDTVVEQVRRLMDKWERCADDAMRTMGMGVKSRLEGSRDTIWYK
ncbi:hypothetical protein F66182_6643 [Fusarium sp. NRRL 66182]|nr:hypothetical protein F66182_6643 [Fusarium sp. NRRL 66182]